MGTAEAVPRRWWRGRAPALALALLAPWLLWLALAHLFLVTPLGERLMAPASGRWRVAWRSGWSLHPGRIHLRGFSYRQGPAAGPGWRITAEHLDGRLAWSALARRELRVEGLRASGVEARRRRSGEGRRATPPAPAPVARRRAGRPAWRIRLSGVELRDVRRIDGGALALAGRGTARGALDVRVGQSTLAVLDRARFDDARLALSGEPFASGLVVEARGRLGPYAPRTRRGLAALERLDGELVASGRSLRRVPGAAHATLLALGSPLRGRLLVRAGRLEPGSHLRLELPAEVLPGPVRGGGPAGAAPAAPRLELLVSPPTGGTPAELLVRIEAPALAVSRGGARAEPPLLSTGPVRLLARTPERRLSRLLARRPRLGELTAEAAVAHPRLRGVRLGPLLADLEAESVRGRIDLAALLRRELRLAKVEGEGIALALEPAAGVDPRRAERPPWSVVVDESQLGVRAVRLGDLAAEGAGTLGVALEVDPHGDLEVRRFAVRLAGARLVDRGAEAARGIEVEIDARLARTPLRAGVAEIVSAVDGRIALRGEMERLGFLDHVARARRWVRLDGSGRLDLELAVGGGRLRPGSRVEVSGGTLEAAGLGWLASGSGDVRGGVEGETTRLVVNLRRLEARAAGDDGPPPLRGRRLELTLLSRDLDLTAPASSLRAELRLTGGEAPDLARFASLLPAGAGLRLRGGRATVEAELAADTAGETARGRLRIGGRDVVLALPELELDGRVALDLALVAEELREGRFRVDGSRVEVTGLRWRESGGEARVRGEEWWGRMELRPATLSWGSPVGVDGTASFELRDSAPLISLLARRRQLPLWVERAVAVRDVRGTARVRLRPDGLGVEALEARGGPLELLARLLFAGERRRGHLYVGLGPLGVGAALEGPRRDLRLIRPRAWYQSLPPLE